MAENSSGEAERPTVEQSAPVREAPTLVGLGESVPLPPPVLPSPSLPPGAPPRLPPVSMEPRAGVAPGRVVLIAVAAALAGAALTALFFIVFG